MYRDRTGKSPGRFQFLRRTRNDITTSRYVTYEFTFFFSASSNIIVFIPTIRFHTRKRRTRRLCRPPCVTKSTIVRARRISDKYIYTWLAVFDRKRGRVAGFLTIVIVVLYVTYGLPRISRVWNKQVRSILWTSYPDNGRTNVLLVYYVFKS